jgi:glycosyltransferase involved in cell wall biosynthesis
MKIWLVNHFAYGPDQSASTRHFEFARALKERGHEVLIVASSFYHKGRREDRLSAGEKYKRQELSGVWFQWLRTPPYGNSALARLWNMVVFAWHVRAKKWCNDLDAPDVVLGSSPDLLSALGAYWLAKSEGARFIFEVRDLWPEALVDLRAFSRRNPAYWVFKWMERFLYRKANEIITVPPESEEYIIENGGNSSKIWVIPNGVNLEQRPPLMKQHSGPFTLVYFGAHGRYSGLTILADAAEILRQKGWGSTDVRFVLIGDPPKNDIEERISELDVDAYFDLHPAVPKSQLWKEIDDADAFLMIAMPLEAHKQGISPNKMWEYFATGKPVLFSIHGGEALVKRSQAGIAVRPGSSLALAEGIEWLAELPKYEREKLGKNGREYVEREGDIRLLAERMERALSGERREV